MDAPPRFSRHTLTLIILVTVVMIALMGQQGREKNIDLPPPPQFKITALRTDSGTPLWFIAKPSSPSLARLSCLAGSAFAPDGAAYALQQLLNQQARRQNIPLIAELDRDNLYLNMQFSQDPWQLKKQLDALRGLLWQPQLDNSELQALRDLPLLPPASDSIFASLPPHPYRASLLPTAEQLGTLTRLQIQQFAQAYLHPARCQLTLLADLAPNAAQVLAETLLPVSSHAASEAVMPPLPHAVIAGGISMPPLNPGDNIGLLVLAAWAANNNINVQRTALGAGQVWQIPAGFVQQVDDGDLKNSLNDAKKQLVKRWLQNLDEPAALLQTLSTLQRQGAPVNFFDEGYALLRALDSGTLRATADTWFNPPQNGTSKQ
ncbi:MAG: insulinase family protein [Oceanospirillaceae bacterium]|nr:insulinase family protein [Oceanospirillaceae bacterium]